MAASSVEMSGTAATPLVADLLHFLSASSFTLPVAAPLVALYAASLTFAAYTPAAGIYTMQGAGTGGTPVNTTPVTLAAGATASRDITLP